MARRAMLALALVAFGCLQFATLDAKSALYNTTGGTVPGKLNVHIISHTHNDPGWLSSYAQYHRTLVLDGHVIGGVESILDTAVSALIDNPDRTFVYADMAFFVKWWQELHEDTKAVVRRLVAEKRLEFTNGGITQHDEATSHYSGMVDQMTLGMRFLYNEFGVQPKIAWQLDGFGHSNAEPLLKAMGGFDSVFFGRSDMADMEQRKAQHQLELVWRGSLNFGTESDVFTSQYPTGNYGPPSMTWFFERRNDYAKPLADSVKDDPETHEFNMDDMVKTFVQRAHVWQSCVPGNDVIFKMGSDFTHSDAHMWFHNVDKMIHYVNKDGRVNAFYSTPSQYVAAKRASPGVKWALKTDDFFPYSGNAQGTDYWTGYFTSRPTLKMQVRRGWSLLQAARQVELLAELQPSSRLLATTRGMQVSGAQAKSEVVQFGYKLAPDHDTAVLEFALATALHHDGITGTQKKPVTQDYEEWLHIGMVKAAPKFLQGLQHLLYPGENINNLAAASTPGAPAAAKPKMPIGAIFRRALAAATASNNSTASSGNATAATSAAAAAAPNVPDLSMCLLLNASLCTSTVGLSRAQDFLVVVYNPLAWSYEWGVRIPVDDGAYTVQGPDGKDVPAQFVPISHATEIIWAHTPAAKADANKAKSELVFMAKPPPLGHAVYKILKGNNKAAAAASAVQGLAGQELKLSTGKIEVTVSPGAGGISSVSFGGRTYNYSQELLKYTQSMHGSGAYTFKANSKSDALTKPEVSIVKGPLVQEVRQNFGDLGVLVARLWKGQEHLEVSWTVGPPPQGTNWEAFVRYTSDVKSEGVFFTDASGREYQQRKRNYRPAFKLAGSSMQLPGNIYPVTTGCYLSDKTGEMHIAIDRAQGAVSMADGQMDINVHRVSAGDDGKGMREALVDAFVASGTHIISFGKPDGSASSEYTTYRHYEQVLNDPFQLAFSAVPAGKSYEPTSSGLVAADALPANVHLLTTKWLSCETVLVRLSHMFQAGEHPSLADTATVVDLHKVLKLKVVKIEEATLYGERPLKESDATYPKFDIGANLTRWDPPIEVKKKYTFLGNRLVGPIAQGTKITLHPMQIRTFFFTVQRTHSSCVDPPEPVRKVQAAPGTVAAAGGAAAGGVGAVAGGTGSAAGAASWFQEVEAKAEKAAGGLMQEVGAGVTKAAEWEATAISQVKKGSAALVHKISGTDTAGAPLSRSGLLIVLMIPFAVAVGIAFMLFSHSKRGHHYSKPVDAKV